MPNYAGSTYRAKWKTRNEKLEVGISWFFGWVIIYAQVYKIPM